MRLTRRAGTLHGFQWVQHGSDDILVALATGIILEFLPDHRAARRFTRLRVGGGSSTWARTRDLRINRTFGHSAMRESTPNRAESVYGEYRIDEDRIAPHSDRDELTTSDRRSGRRMLPDGFHLQAAELAER